jgi:sortase (surface protein transpeptidase)
VTDDAEVRPSTRARWVALAAALGVAAAACLVMWGASAQTTTPVTGSAAHPAVRPADPATSRPETRDLTAAVAPEARAALPVALSIPAIDVRTHLLRLGERQDGTVEVPGNPALAGWFRLGPPPGASGSSVILGHVDSMNGPAVFYRLKELQAGDRIDVRMDDGTTVRFRVHSSATYPNADFPAKKVYGRQGRSQLNLVTCGGAYDAARGGYQSNVVVNARRTA